MLCKGHTVDLNCGYLTARANICRLAIVLTSSHAANEYRGNPVLNCWQGSMDVVLRESLLL